MIRRPSARDAAWFLAGYDTGQNVGRLEGHRDGFRAGYSEGHDTGFEAGLEHAAAARSAEIEALDRALVADLTARPDFVTLARRRGDHDRADRAEHHLARIAALPGPFATAAEVSE